MAFGLLNNKSSGFAGTLNGTPIARSAPWSVSNVKSNRTDSFVNGNLTTSIGNDIAGDAGHTYQVDSSAIQSARYDPSDSSLNISYRSNPGKEYKFSATANDAAEWLQSPSKGRETQLWRSTHRYPGY